MWDPFLTHGDKRTIFERLERMVFVLTVSVKTKIEAENASDHRDAANGEEKK